MDFDKAFGKAVKDIRISRGLTQEFFTDISSRTHISRLELGQSGATLNFINKIAAALNVHPLTIISLAYLNTGNITDLSELQNVVKKDIQTLGSKELQALIKD
ncbi:helix-turn-helix transcriptional regulator [Methylophilus sp. 13]|uniref:helix-turn-helix domain-containing protein n=1 Tax=Methylophilus sp. 13 TaxID=2781018 RepID=UPI00188FE240|nr:helix-turn-helix transcriptional regulator [Methylophilus sp. 13]MBF5037948.1 helix-turn-helix transcriptional regulator [Methylophilus sp. 13]